MYISSITNLKLSLSGVDIMPFLYLKGTEILRVATCYDELI